MNENNQPKRRGRPPKVKPTMPIPELTIPENIIPEMTLSPPPATPAPAVQPAAPPKPAAQDCCPDWNQGRNAIRNVVAMAFKNGITYNGKPFVFCPWCGRKRQ
jgi:hypothetical protein